jgi:putative ubiquitin-RnfH superfamily antitoxin RatB of RatAB toxin-antitoxin module
MIGEALAGNRGGVGEKEALISVEVCFAEVSRIFRIRLEVPPGTTCGQAIAKSGVLASANIQDMRKIGLGVYGKRKRFDDLVNDGDRIELSRPLQADPKLARQRRALKSR